MRPTRPLPPSQSWRPARNRGNGPPRTHGQGDPQLTTGSDRGCRDVPLKAPPLQAGRDSTGPRHRHRPPGQLGPYATGLPIPAAMQLNRRGAEDAPHQWGHDADDPGADEEMTEASGPQRSSASQPTAASCSMSAQQQPSSGNVPEGHLGTTQGHPSPTGTTPDQDQRTMPLPAPRPPQRRNTDLFDEAELRAVYNIHANTSLCGLVAALREHLQDINPNRLFAVVALPQAASTDISLWQLQALVTPGMQIADDLDLVLQH